MINENESHGKLKHLQQEQTEIEVPNKDESESMDVLNINIENVSGEQLEKDNLPQPNHQSGIEVPEKDNSQIEILNIEEEEDENEVGAANNEQMEEDDSIKQDEDEDSSGSDLEFLGVTRGPEPPKTLEMILEEFKDEIVQEMMVVFHDIRGLTTALNNRLISMEGRLERIEGAIQSDHFFEKRKRIDKIPHPNGSSEVLIDVTDKEIDAKKF
eukprot:CAMPEP_0117880842 /NCGR_PEP_ID=MMETSP0950-20121206/16422_1 /TAXON_ID=44440 /ORGANISM="Chattonella subsalsa, Strain CCMP2191" /LENGTH=212 /DNA_ID=CAMNT_0005735889 /DNA_START=36 /DNA_END=671 /DNA_ORIENTATION=-